MSGSSEGRVLHEGSEPAAVGDSMAGKAGTSQRWETVPQLPSKGDRVGLVSEPMGRRGPGMAGQACGWVNGSTEVPLEHSLGGRAGLRA